jgi:hypothetical protein
MLQRLSALSLALVALAAVPAAAHAANIVVPSSTTVEARVPAGRAVSLGVRCHEPSVALNAAVPRLGSGVELRRSAPGREAGDWGFRFAAGRSGGRRVEVELRCVKLALPEGVRGAGLEVFTRSELGVRVDPGTSVPIDLGCASGYAPTGYGIDRGSRGDIRVASAVPTAGGWSFRLENIGDRTARAGARVRCLKQRVGARREGRRVALRFGLVRREFRDTGLHGGTPSFLHACRARQFSLATGIELDPLDAIVLTRSHPLSRRGGQWAFARASPGDAVTSHLVCLRRDTRFR